MRIRAAASAAVIVVFLAAGSASAAPATSDRVLALAHDASFDNEVLGRLLKITEIDGHPVDLERLLQGASGAEIEQRVDLLVDEIARGGSGTDPDSARDQARDILTQRRFSPAQVPRPFRGILRTIAGWLDPVATAMRKMWDAIVRAYNALGSATPGGTATLWVALGLIVLAGATWGTRRLIAKRTQRIVAGLESSGSVARDDPHQLERAAARAAARGDHEEAVRLLFRAGVIRLARARAIPARRSLTTGEIKRKLRSPDFDRLGRSFDEIVYGGRPATKADSSDAHATWREVVRSAQGATH